MTPDIEFQESHFKVGLAATELLVDPANWINRRVETIDLLSHEETRRKVSVDFTLPEERAQELETKHGIAVPISLLTKEPRRNFDLRDESGAAVPVLGKIDNAALAQVAVMRAAVDVLPEDLPKPDFELLWSELRQIVMSPNPENASEALGSFVGSIGGAGDMRDRIWTDHSCRSLLTALSDNYVLFAVLPPGGPTRRILKYSYGEDLDLSPSGSLGERLQRRRWWWERPSRPDRKIFTILCPGAGRAASFHAEIIIPEDLRIESSVLYDPDTGGLLSEPDLNRNRASLYASQPLDVETSADAYVEIAPERRGRTTQAAATGLVVTALLWLDAASGLDNDNPDASVSLLLAGAALYTGITAGHGEHVLVSKLFSASRRWLAVVSLAALAAAACLAMQFPDSHPTKVWQIAAIASSVASARLLWSAIRAPR